MVSTLENDPLLKGIPLVEGWKVLAPVVLYAKIGQGGMGAVYRGRHLDFDIDVAVKCLKPSLAAEDEQFVQRFRREARLAASLTHENLVRVYETRKAHGLHYLVMEFVDGETARDRVQRKGPLGEQEAAAIILGAARGLAKAHRNHEVVVHRDVKPDNILVSRRGEVKLLDLGIAKALEHEDGAATFSTQGVIGTPQYMAPEQWERDQPVGPYTDIWAFGATLFFLLTGENAIRAGTERQVYVDVCQKPFPDVRVKRPEISAALAGILKKCLQKEADQRYSDAGHLADALAAFLGQHTPSLIDEETGVERTLPLVSPPPMPTIKRIRTQVENATGASATPAPPGTIVVRRSSARVWWIGGGIAAAGIAAFAAWKLQGSGQGIELRSGIRVDGVVDGHLYTKEARIAIRGSVTSSDRTSIRATLAGAAGQLCAIEDDGSFQLELPLAKDSSQELSLRQGQTAPPHAITLVQDGTPPEIEILEPLDAARPTNQSKIRVRARVKEANPSSVTLNRAAMESRADGIWVLDEAALPVEGANDLFVSATDRAGNTETKRATVFRDTERPKLVLSTPENDAVFDAGSKLTLALEFDEALASAKVNNDDVTPAGKRITARLDVPASPGQFTVAYSGKDLAGNPFEGSLSFRSQPKTVASFALVPDVAEGGVLYIPGEMLSLDGRIVGAKGPDVQLVIDGKEFSYRLEGAASDEINISRKLPAARAKVELRHGEASRKFEVVRDATPPVLTLVAPQPQEQRTRAARVDVIVSLVEEHPRLVQAGSAPMTKQANGNWLAQVELSNANGNNEVRIQAEDLAGNRSAPLALTLVRDSVPPALALSTPAARAKLEPGAKLALALEFDEPLRSATIAGLPAKVADRRATADLSAPAAPGPWTVRFAVEDQVGNPFSDSLTFDVAAAAPPVVPEAAAIELPELALGANGIMTASSETFEFRPRVAGSGVLTATLDGAPLACNPIDGGYSISAKLPPDVPCTIVLACGTARRTLKVCFDTQPPAVEIVSPAVDAAPTRERKVAVVARVVEANLATLRCGETLCVQQPDGTWRAENVPLAQEGEQELSIEALDGAGHSARASVRVRRDTVPPALLAESEPKTAAAVVPGQALAFRLLFDEPIASVKVGVLATPGDGNSARFELAVPEGGGAWDVAGVAVDLAGNEAPLAWRFERPGAPTPPAPRLVALAGFTAVGTACNALGYPETLRHDATGIELVALDLKPNAKPALYVSTRLVTEKQFNGKGGDKPKVSVSAESLMNDFFPKRGKGLELPTEGDWRKLSASSNPAVRSLGGSLDELLQGAFEKSSWPTRSAKGKEGSQPRNSSLPVLGFRVVYRVK